MNCSFRTCDPIDTLLEHLSPEHCNCHVYFQGPGVIRCWHENKKYVSIPVADHDRLLRPDQSVTVALEFSNPSGQPIDYDTRVLDVVPAP